MQDDQTRRDRMHAALEGLSVGDAVGQRMMDDVLQGGHLPISLDDGTFSARIREYEPPADARLYYTDDTNMALSLVAVLQQHGQIDQDALATSFARHFALDRGYGPGMINLLTRVGRGADWRDHVQTLFGDQGSFGNGAAMRVAPLGAFFADDLALAAEQAARSAEVTHAHPEGIAGAVAVALAAAIAAQWRTAGQVPDAGAFFDQILALTPPGLVYNGIATVRQLPASTPMMRAAVQVGNGSRISAQDTVPLALWCAIHALDDYAAAVRQMASALGDIDTNCAIVGGIVASYTGAEAIPASWQAQREPLPAWAFEA